MPEIINWLHLTDLHMGLDPSGWLWPKMKHDLFRDIEKVGARRGPWDLVFFTGDLTQRGQAAEFDRLNKELEELWAVLRKCGHEPSLCVVPGNHDLVRPDPDSALAKAMTQLWWTDTTVRNRFWRDADSEYRRAVDGFFATYTAWLSSAPIPILTRTTGILPGDFSSKVTKGSAKLGIIGLNTTFLQITGDPFEQKLDIHVSQLNAVCDGDPERWLRDQTAAVLLTHQPPTWLAVDAYDHFRAQIYPSGRFISQLCGHLHEPQVVEVTEAGAPPRRLRQGASLFGLEKWGLLRATDRTQHGYAAGQFLFDEAGGRETLWPRCGHKGRDGGMNVAPDHTFRLSDDDSIVTAFSTRDEEVSFIDPAAIGVLPPKLSSESGFGELHLLEPPPTEPAARKELAASPRFVVSVTPQHRRVRQEEQSQFEHYLRSSHLVWLVADWGTGKDGFVSAALERFRSPELRDVFHIRCDEATTETEFEALFPQQCGMQLATLCGMLAQLRSGFLILDGIHPALISGTKLARLRQIVSAIVDYCPTLSIIITCRVKPEGMGFDVVELHSLDIPDTRTYLTDHADTAAILQEPDVIEKLHEQSEGLPMHLDRMLKALKVASMASVLEAEMAGAALGSRQAESTPLALVHTVNQLAKSGDSVSERSFRLLKVLSVLPYGETLDVLKHYLPTEPFFHNNAVQLHEMALLDVIVPQQAAASVGDRRSSGVDDVAPKILKVPRQVRDYVATLLTDKERDGIVEAGIDVFFGRAWREGKIKVRRTDMARREHAGAGAGNEFALVRYLIAQSRTRKDKRGIEQAATLGLSWASRLRDVDRYRDVALAAGPLIELLDRQEHPATWARLAVRHGAALRMMGRESESIEVLRDALAVGGDCLSTNEKANVWINVAFAERGLGNSEGCIAAAEQAKVLAESKSVLRMQAQTIVTQETLKGEERRTRLGRLEKSFRSAGHQVLADNIAIDLAEEATGDERIRELDRVLASREDSYNRVRAIVGKAEAIIEGGRARVLDVELSALSRAYSYLHAQRFEGLFDRCHTCLWVILQLRGDTAGLLRLFRHSSFVWRLRGQEDEEAKYIGKLDEHEVKEAERAGSKGGILAEIRYFLRRVSAMLSEG
jgi:predicted MPP superfamily phosphohydrolase